MGEIIGFAIGIIMLLMAGSYRCGYKAGCNARTQQMQRRRVDRSEKHFVKPQSTFAFVAQPPMDRETLSKALRDELNKGRRANPDVVERLATLNNAMVNAERHHGH